MGTWTSRNQSTIYRCPGRHKTIYKQYVFIYKQTHLTICFQEMADRHVLLKHSCHEIAQKHGRSLTFMAKYCTEMPGSSCHIHSSLWSLDGNTPLFLDQKGWPPLKKNAYIFINIILFLYIFFNEKEIMTMPTINFAFPDPF